jgi:hypothetical protein
LSKFRNFGGWGGLNTPTPSRYATGANLGSLSLEIGPHAFP